MAESIGDLERTVAALQAAAALPKKDERLAAASSAGLVIDSSASASDVTAAINAAVIQAFGELHIALKDDTARLTKTLAATQLAASVSPPPPPPPSGAGGAAAAVPAPAPPPSGAGGAAAAVPAPAPATDSEALRLLALTLAKKISEPKSERMPEISALAIKARRSRGRSRITTLLADRPNS